MRSLGVGRRQPRRIDPFEAATAFFAGAIIMLLFAMAASFAVSFIGCERRIALPPDQVQASQAGQAIVKEAPTLTPEEIENMPGMGEDEDGMP